MYLTTLPTVMETNVMTGFALISPRRMVIADPSRGTKAKNPMYAPRPRMKRRALSMSFGDTCRYFSNHSSLPSMPTQ